ncbi:MAG: CHASE sensor domain-containing protein [Pseudomonadota bacterium]
MSSVLQGHNLSIRTKLLLMMSLTTVLALILVATALVVNEKVNARKYIAEELSSMAEVIASNSGAALAFNDQDAALGMLKSLRVKPEIIHADVHDAQGVLFAEYSHNGPSNASVRERMHRHLDEKIRFIRLKRTWFHEEPLSST